MKEAMGKTVGAQTETNVAGQEAEPQSVRMYAWYNKWCRRRGSNPHGHEAHRILRAKRLNFEALDFACWITNWTCLKFNRQ